VGRCPAEDLVLLLEQPDPLPGHAQLGVLVGRGTGLDPVLDVGGLDPVGQAGLADPEVCGDLFELLSWLTVPRDADDVVAELLGVRLWHGIHPSSSAAWHHRSDVTYPCSSPWRS